MDRIKRISAEILERYPENFGTDFDQNKATLKKIAVVRSKLLRNRISWIHHGISSQGKYRKRFLRRYNRARNTIDAV